MTQFEFENLTKVEVSAGEFEAINIVYMMSDLDKEAFCKMWCKINKTRVANAKAERIARRHEEAKRDCLWAWFNKWHTSREKLIANYNTPIAHTKLTTAQVVAMSHAGVKCEGTLSDVLYEVGKYLGVYNA